VYSLTLFIACLTIIASLCDLQVMINICCHKLEKLDIKLNVKKSQVVRIGRAHRNDVHHQLVVDDKTVDSVDELKNLLLQGVNLISLHTPLLSTLYQENPAYHIS